MHRAQPDPEQGQAHADPEQDVLQAHVADARQVGHGADVDEEVGQHEEDRAQNRQGEQAGDLLFGTLGRGLAEIGSARHVRGQAGVLETVGDAALTDDVTLVETDGVLAESLGGGDVLVVHRLIDPVDVRWMWASVNAGEMMQSRPPSVCAG